MDRVKVESSQIASVGYDVKKNVLEIEFKTGAVYQYQKVEKLTYEMMMKAGTSVGGFFTMYIKKNPAKYPFVKVGAATKEVNVVEVEVVSETPEAVTILVRVETMPDKARAIRIVDSTTYIAAAEFLKGIKSLRAEVDAAFDPIISKAHATHKEAVGQKRHAETPLVEAEEVVKFAIAGYLKQAEVKRLAEESAQRKEIQDKIRAQAEEENIKRAQELAEAGDMDGAAEAVDAEIVVPDVPVHVVASVPKVAGIASRTNYVIASVDLAVLVAAVAAGKAPLECLTPDYAFLGKQARAYKKAGELFAGVMVKTDDNIAAGRG